MQRAVKHLLIQGDATMASTATLTPESGAVVDLSLCTVYLPANVSSGDYKASVIYATAAVLPNSPTASGSGVGKTLTAGSNTTLTVDGVTVAVGERVLVKNQASSQHNGIYVLTAAGSGAAPWVLTRATDFDTWLELPGAVVSVESGFTNAGSQWVCNVTAGGTIETTAITFTVPKNYLDLTSNQTVAGIKTFASVVLTTADINGGTIDGTVIGGSTPAAGTFTTINGLTISATTGTLTIGLLVPVEFQDQFQTIGAFYAGGNVYISDQFSTESNLFFSGAHDATITLTGTTNITLPTSGTVISTSNLGTGVATWLATPSGANLASALTSALPLTKGGTGGTTAYTAIVGIGLINPIGRVVIWDDFYGGNGTSGTLGELGWTFLNQVGTGSGTGSVTASSSHVGAYKVTSGATSGNASSIYIPNGSVALTNSFDTRVWEMWARVKIDQVTTVGAYIGLHWSTSVATILDPAGSGSNNKGYFICFDTGITTPDTQWSLKVCSDATGTLNKVSTAAFTGTISADTWYVFRMRGDGTGTTYATMYDSTGTIVGSEISVPSTNAISNACAPMPQIVTRTASARAVTIDFIGFACQMTR